MSTTDKRKRSLYFPDNILSEMQSEAKRQERSLSWIVQYAWRLARNELMRLPSVGSAKFTASETMLDNDQNDDSEDTLEPGHHHGNEPIGLPGHNTHHSR